MAYQKACSCSGQQNLAVVDMPIAVAALVATIPFSIFRLVMVIAIPYEDLFNRENVNKRKEIVCIHCHNSVFIFRNK